MLQRPHQKVLQLTFSFFLLLMILSRPLKAPDATNRMLVVSTCTVSPLNFLEFFSGTFTIVPSSSFSKPYGGRQGPGMSSRNNTPVKVMPHEPMEWTKRDLVNLRVYRGRITRTLFDQWVTTFKEERMAFQPVALLLLLHLSADGFQERCQSCPPHPGTLCLPRQGKTSASGYYMNENLYGWT